MKFFPGIKVTMGSWSYYTIKIKFADLDNTLSFAKSLGSPSALDAVMQRNLNATKASIMMRKFLANQNERFYSAITIANIGSENPDNWLPLSLDTIEEKIEEVGSDSDALGYLKISDDDQFYILDGQHRVASIISIINPNSLFLEFGDADSLEKKLKDIENKAPLPADFDMEAFKNEQLTVLVLNKTNEDDEVESRISYRRLFSNLNRYAKPTTTTTNIIISEDDSFYILTRRLVENFSPFSLENESFAFDNPNVDIDKTNFSGGEQQFTTMQSLASMNEILLKINKFPELQTAKNDDEVRTLRQDDDDLDMWYDELEKRWTVILNVFSELTGDRTSMRSHNASIDEDGRSDHPFLWPKPQTDCIIPVIKKIFDRADSPDEYEELLKEFKDLDIWDMRKTPWFRLILIPTTDDPDGEKKIRQDDQTTMYKIATELLEYLMGISPKDDEELLDFKSRVLPELKGNDAEKEEWWEEFLSLKT